MPKARGAVTKAEINRALDVARENGFEIDGFAVYSEKGKVEIQLRKPGAKDRRYPDPDDLLKLHHPLNS